MLFKKYLPIALLLVLLIMTSDINAQCAMCRASAEHSSIAKGLNTGILYLLLMPFLFIASITIIWIKNKKKFSHNDK